MTAFRAALIQPIITVVRFIPDQIVDAARREALKRVEAISQSLRNRKKLIPYMLSALHADDSRNGADEQSVNQLVTQTRTLLQNTTPQGISDMISSNGMETSDYAVDTSDSNIPLRNRLRVASLTHLPAERERVWLNFQSICQSNETEQVLH